MWILLLQKGQCPVHSNQSVKIGRTFFHEESLKGEHKKGFYKIRGSLKEGAGGSYLSQNRAEWSFVGTLSPNTAGSQKGGGMP